MVEYWNRLPEGGCGISVLGAAFKTQLDTKQSDVNKHDLKELDRCPLEILFNLNYFVGL